MAQAECVETEFADPTGDLARSRRNLPALGLKRLFDIVVGIPLAIAALPLIILLGTGCALTLRASPLFVQRRVGRGGRHFSFPKLRTLPKGTPPSVDKYALNGMRTSPFCRLLRRTHLDELPQLLLVPFGVMSLVGPRPEMPDIAVRYPVEFAAERNRMRPGCTGLWQVSRSVTKLIYEDPEYDLLYVRRGGPLLECWILYRTLRMSLSRGALIELYDVPAWALGRGYVIPQTPAGALGKSRMVTAPVEVPQN